MYGDGFDNGNPDRPSIIEPLTNLDGSSTGLYVITCKRCSLSKTTDSASHAILVAVDHDQEHKGAIREGDA